MGIKGRRSGFGRGPEYGGSRAWWEYWAVGILSMGSLGWWRFKGI